MPEIVERNDSYDHAFKNAAAGGLREVVPAPASDLRIVVHSYTEQTGLAADTIVRWKSANTAISADHENYAGTGRSCGFNPKGWFVCAAGEALNLEVGAGATVGTEVTFSLQPLPN